MHCQETLPWRNSTITGWWYNLLLLNLVSRKLSIAVDRSQVQRPRVQLNDHHLHSLRFNSASIEAPQHGGCTPLLCLTTPDAAQITPISHSAPTLRISSIPEGNVRRTSPHHKHIVPRSKMTPQPSRRSPAAVGFLRSPKAV